MSDIISQATPTYVVADGGVEVPAQRPASVLDEITAARVAAARALALSLGVEQGTDITTGLPFPTVWLVTGGTRSRGELTVTPFVAVVTRDEHSAWTAAIDLVGKSGARVDAMPLL